MTATFMTGFSLFYDLRLFLIMLVDDLVILEKTKFCRFKFQQFFQYARVKLQRKLKSFKS